MPITGPGPGRLVIQQVFIEGLRSTRLWGHRSGQDTHLGLPSKLKPREQSQKDFSFELGPMSAKTWGAPSVSQGPFLQSPPNLCFRISAYSFLGSLAENLSFSIPFFSFSPREAFPGVSVLET